jgi:hypothetical protein
MARHARYLCRLQVETARRSVAHSVRVAFRGSHRRRCLLAIHRLQSPPHPRRGASFAAKSDFDCRGWSVFVSSVLTLTRQPDSAKRHVSQPDCVLRRQWTQPVDRNWAPFPEAKEVGRFQRCATMSSWGRCLRRSMNTGLVSKHGARAIATHPAYSRRHAQPHGACGRAQHRSPSR